MYLNSHTKIKIDRGAVPAPKLDRALVAEVLQPSVAQYLLKVDEDLRIRAEFYIFQYSPILNYMSHLN